VNGSNPTRHVIVALALSVLIYIVADDRWNTRLRKITPVRAVAKGE
jgi:hypothetical protein